MKYFLIEGEVEDPLNHKDPKSKVYFLKLEKQEWMEIEIEI